MLEIRGIKRKRSFLSAADYERRKSESITDSQDGVVIDKVRGALSALRQEPLSAYSLDHRLEAIDAKDFPKKDEWRFNYILTLLVGLTKDGNWSDLGAVWSALSEAIIRISRERIKVFMKRVDLVSNLCQFLTNSSASIDERVLSSIISLIKHLAASSVTKSLVAPSPEICYSTLLSSLALRSVPASIQVELVSLLAKNVSTAAKSRSTPKKTQNIMYDLGITALIKNVGAHSDTNSLHELVEEFLLGEVEVLDYKYTTSVNASRLEDPAGARIFRQWSFEVLNKHTKNAVKRLDQRNSLLVRWLDGASDDFASIMEIYHATQADLNVSRPISSNRSILERISLEIEQAVSKDPLNMSAIPVLLTLDVDLSIPKFSPVVWNALAKSADSSLLSKWLLAHSQIRAFPQFVYDLVENSLMRAEILNQPVMNAIAEEIAKSTEGSQRTIIDRVSQTDSMCRDRLLTALCGGLRQGACEDILKLLALRNIVASSSLRKTILMKISSGSTIANHFVDSGDDEDSYSTAQCLLREIELQPDKYGVTTQSQHIDAIVQLCASDYRLAVNIAERWISTTAKHMTLSQRKDLVMALNASAVTDHSYVTLYTKPLLLESEEMHDVIQDHFLQSTNTRSTLAVLNVPIDFFHKAIRHRLVNILASAKDDDANSCKVLLKYAKAGIMPSTEHIRQYIARSMTQLTGGAYPVAMDQNSKDPQQLLRHLYAAQLDGSELREMVSDTKIPIELKIDLLDHLQPIESSDLNFVHSLVTELSEGFRKDTDLTGHSCTLLSSIFRRCAKTSEELRILLTKLDETGDNVKVGTSAGLLDLKNHLVNYAQKKPDCSVSELLAWLSQSSEDVLQNLEHFTHDDFSTSEMISISEALASKLGPKHMHIVVQRLREEPTTAKDTSESGLRLTVACLKTLAGRSESDNRNESQSWLAAQFEILCDQLGDMATADQFDAPVIKQMFEFLNLMLTKHSRGLTIHHLDHFLAAISLAVRNSQRQEIIREECIPALRSSFEHLAFLFKDRYHVVVNLFQQLLECCTDKQSATLVVRLFETFLTSSRSLSTNPEHFNKAFAKHLPWLVIEYIHRITTTGPVTSIMDKEAKTAIEEGMVYEIMGLCSSHEREMMGASLDSSGRGVFKRLYDEWTRFGKWTEK